MLDRQMQSAFYFAYYHLVILSNQLFFHLLPVLKQSFQVYHDREKTARKNSLEKKKNIYSFI